MMAPGDPTRSAASNSSAYDFARSLNARAATERPRLVGFGIADAASARRAAAAADGVIVGSALLEAIAGAGDPASAARAFMEPLRAALS